MKLNLSENELFHNKGKTKNSRKKKTKNKKQNPGSHFNYKLFEAPAAPTSQIFHTPVPLFILNILPQMPLFSPQPTTLSPSSRPNLYSFPL